jgi:chromosome segregation ATPase
LKPECPGVVNFRDRLLAGFALGALLISGCHSTTSFVGDQYYESGSYDQAEAAFVTYLASDSVDGETASRALYRLGVIYATPTSSLHDPARAVESLEQLISRYPESPYTAEAVLLRNLILQAPELERERLRQETALQELKAELAACTDEIFVLQKERGRESARLSLLEAKIPVLEAEIVALTEQLQAKESELEQLDRLKAIDLEAPPPKRRN